MTPLVSIIIAAYKRPDFVNQALESIEAQTLHDYEVFVVDDASGEEFTSQYRLPERATLLVHDKNKQQAAARNTGIAVSKGKYIAIMDQDDIWLPEKLQKQVECLEANPEYPLAFCHYTLVDEGLNPLPCDKEPIESVPNALEMLIDRCFIKSPSTIMFRRDITDEIGLFDESIPHTSDWDFYFRIARKYPLLAMPEALIQYRMSPGQLHKQYSVMHPAQCVVYEKNLQWAKLNRPDLVRHIKYRYALTLRLMGKSLMCYQHKPRAALPHLAHAVRLWPWDRLTCWYFMRSVIGSLVSRGDE